MSMIPINDGTRAMLDDTESTAVQRMSPTSMSASWVLGRVRRGPAV
jgi:hypothetical protein